MSHTYASVADLGAYITDSDGVLDDRADEALTVLEGASRTIDKWCDRSRFGSGFGPRVASNRYDTSGESELDLRDDFVSVTSITALDGTNGASLGTLTVDDDYFVLPYDDTPKRRIVLHGEGAISAFGAGYRTVTVAGTAGYGQELLTTTATIGTATASATSITLTAGSGVLSPGHTFRLDSEDIYVTGVSAGTVLTVLRGQNGTTAAIHGAGTAQLHRYPREVVACALALAQRRWKQRTSGVTGDFGMTQVVQPRDTEWSILRAHVGHLRLFHAG